MLILLIGCGVMDLKALWHPASEDFQKFRNRLRIARSMTMSFLFRSYRNSAIISHRTSRLHRGSAEDYQHVRNVIAQLKVQPREGPPPKKKATAKQPVDIR